MAKGVAGSVKKRKRLPHRSFLRHRVEHRAFFTLRQTHFFTRDRYAQDEEYSLPMLLIQPRECLHSQGGCNKETSSSVVLLAGATGAISAAVSMMAGTFLDIESPNDQAKAQLAREQPEIDKNLAGANLLDANVRGATLNFASLTEALISDEQLSTVKSRLEERQAGSNCIEGRPGFFRAGGATTMANQQQLDLLRQGVTEFWNRWRLDNPDTQPELQGVDLTQANLGGLDLTHADLSGADLSGADLNNANLSGAKLVVANLSGANLAGANLSGADLSGANLAGADLVSADLNEANLTGANVRAANFIWTNVSQAIITTEQLKLARFSADDF